MQTGREGLTLIYKTAYQTYLSKQIQKCKAGFEQTTRLNKSIRNQVKKLGTDKPQHDSIKNLTSKQGAGETVMITLVTGV